MDGSVEERRRHPRSRASSLQVRVDGREFDTVEWSFGGFLLQGSERSMSAGALVRVQSIKAGGDEPVPVNIRARVAWADAEKGRTALSCLNMDSDAYMALARIRDGG